MYNFYKIISIKWYFQGNLILSENNQTLLKNERLTIIEKNIENPEDLNVLNLQTEGELYEGTLNREKLYDNLNSEEKSSNNQILDKILQKSSQIKNRSSSINLNLNLFILFIIFSIKNIYS
jgi:hypothetical protein